MIKIKMGVEGSGGVILCLNEQVRISYAWGLGRTTNNQAEFWDLWQGLRLSLLQGIRNVTIIEYFLLVIKKVHEVHLH